MEVLEKQNSYLADFTRCEKTLTGGKLPWLRATRSLAISRFEALGFPTTRQEAWRFTDVAPLAKIGFRQSDGLVPSAFDSAALKDLTFSGLESFQLVFVNGRYVPGLSSVPKFPSEVKAGSLATFLDSNASDLERHLARHADMTAEPFTALNTAFMNDGAHIYLPKGMVLKTPIHLLFVSTTRGQPAVSHPRVLIVAEQDTKASIVESYIGLKDDPYWTNAVTEVVLGENARLTHYKLEREKPQAFHISTLQVHQARSSAFTSHAILLGGALVRSNINVVLDSEGAECDLNGLYLVTGRQHVDSHTLIDHVKPHGASREYYKGILDEQAHGVFDGRIIVQKEAQKTDAMQANKNLLLSNEALVNTKPELKIFANDVKCKHGATIGQINADSLFYLRSRGIDQETARRLLVYAFASEMIERVEIPSLRQGLESLLFGKFEHPRV